MSNLERRYRVLLQFYPPESEPGRTDEMISTLMDASAEGQAWPTARETLDLVLNGLRERARCCGGGERAAAKGRLASISAIGLVSMAALMLTVEILGTWKSPPSASYVSYWALVAIAAAALLVDNPIRRLARTGVTPLAAAGAIAGPEVLMAQRTLLLAVVVLAAAAAACSTPGHGASNSLRSRVVPAVPGTLLGIAGGARVTAAAQASFTGPRERQAWLLWNVVHLPAITAWAAEPAIIVVSILCWRRPSAGIVGSVVLLPAVLVIGVFASNPGTRPSNALSLEAALVAVWATLSLVVAVSRTLTSNSVSPEVRNSRAPTSR